MRKICAAILFSGTQIATIKLYKHIRTSTQLYFPMLKAFLPVFFSFFTLLLSAQQLPDFKIIDSPGQLKIADSQITDKDGWTHFYSSSNNEILISIHGGEANIGSIKDGLAITSGLLGNYGKFAQDLTTADYVEDTHRWFVFNRYFRMERAPEIDTTLRIRFYFNEKDINDIGNSITELEEKATKPEDLNFFTISDINTHPFTESAKKNGGTFTLHHPPKGAAPTWFPGLFSGWKYAEMSVNSLNISGGGGKYIKPFDGRFTATGFVKTRDGESLEGVEILEKGNVVATTDANGFYEVDGLVKNENYKFSARLNAQASRGVTVLDMAYLKRGLKKTRLLKDPWMQIAADANYSDFLTASDMSKMRDAILHTDTTFAGNGAWQFVTKGYEFPGYGDPFKVGIPESHAVNQVKEDIKNLDFTAIKTGDLVSTEKFPNKPPLDINPVFELSDEVSCGTGDTVLVDLTVKEFRRIMGFQFSIHWDENILQFLGASDFNLSGLDKNSCGFRYRNEGKLGMAWTTISQRGSSVKDGTVICQLKFLANGKNGETTRLEFGEYPSKIEILRDNFSAANTLLSVGSVVIDNQSPLQLADIDIRNISCAGEKNGAINLNVKGSNGNYRMKWSNGSDASYLTNLSGGKYNVTVYDSEACPLVSEDFVINDPQKLRMGGSQNFPITCPGANDGRINIRVLGGTEPYSFTWSNGAITQNIRGLSAGNYDLTITDVEGCHSFEKFKMESQGDIFLGISLSDETTTKGNDGAVRINKIFGGTDPYLYEWSNGGSTNGIEGLQAGNYAVTIYDNEGCENELTFEIKNINDNVPQTFTFDIQSETVVHGETTYFKIVSPINQNVGFKLFDMRSKQIKKESLSLLRGNNTHYFKAPEEEGTYLLQILPSTGGVQSLRVAVK